MTDSSDSFGSNEKATDRNDGNDFQSVFDRFAGDVIPSAGEKDMMKDYSFRTPEGEIVGNPEQVLIDWDGKQSYTDTCAIRCQEYVIECFTGSEIDEHQLVVEAHENGWYTPGGGTSPSDVGNLLELHGIEVNRFENSNIFHLADELAKGHKVIVGVDSGELWNRMPFFEDLDDALGFEAADHALIVSGIDTTDPGNPQVIISDPGTGEAAARYPLEQFVDAWKDSDFTMVSTVEPAPTSLSEMANFDQFRGMLLSGSLQHLLSYLSDLWLEVGEEGDFPYPLPDTVDAPSLDPNEVEHYDVETSRIDVFDSFSDGDVSPEDQPSDLDDDSEFD